MLTKLKRLGLWDVSLNMLDMAFVFEFVLGMLFMEVVLLDDDDDGPPKTSPSLARSENGTTSIVAGSIAKMSSDAAFDFADVSC